MKQTIIDTLPFKVLPQQITEGKRSQNGNLLVKGRLQTAETKNGNGRIYPRPILEREVKNYMEGPIKESRAMGELDHPDSSVVNLQNVSHNITEMHWEGKNLVGTVEVLGTPSGNILTELFKAGIKLGISSRGMGSVQPMSEGDGQQVGDDFELIAFDFVSNPSTHGAFLYPMKESVGNEIPITEGRTCGKYCKVESIINDIIRGE